MNAPEYYVVRALPVLLKLIKRRLLLLGIEAYVYTESSGRDFM
jgi:hypothetical protein